MLSASSSPQASLCLLLPALLSRFPQAAYLVGVSDPNSQAGQQGLVDPTQFARANQAIQMACQNLIDPACTQSQVSGTSRAGARFSSAAQLKPWSRGS